MVNDELLLARSDRLSGFVGRTSDEVAAEMERGIAKTGERRVKNVAATRSDAQAARKGNHHG
jgi:hypothetical protein